MKLIRALRLAAALIGVAILATLAGNLFFPHSSFAAGETYTWKNYNTITVSGGDLKGTSELQLTNNPISGDQAGIFSGQLLFNKGGNKGCTITIQLVIYKSSGNGKGTTIHPPPYDGPVLGDPNAPPACWQAGVHDLDPQFNNQQVAIGGTRPADPNDTSETPEEKQATIGILAPDPQSKAPKTVTITIKQNGKTVATQTVPFEPDSGANWPPDQMPVAARATFTLEPGLYTVCDNYVIPNCKTFEKVKGTPFYENYGTEYVTPDKRMINVHVAFHVIRPCNTTITVKPLSVSLKLPNGQIISQETNSRTLAPNPDEKNGDCNVDEYIGLDTSFANMKPGTYEACSTNATCVTFVKSPDAAANITLEVETTLQPPADQKVCTAGDGIAGALTIIVCPFTEIAAKATEFFEKYIIVPFMTVSPLTTNDKNPVYILWQDFRNLANIGFIVFFFFIIFSQATSVGISRYGLKSMLSKIFIVVLGVNLSYFGVAFVIDAFNVFGAGLSSLVVQGLKDAGTQQLNGGTAATPVQSIFVLGGAALAAVILSGGAIIGWLFSLIGLAMLVIVVVIAVLLARQVLIIMLVILSPIAILLYMLPNTEGYFQKWRKTLVQLLLMYPMIVLLFASGKIFGIILQQPNLFEGGALSDDVAEALRVILQFFAYIIPLAFLPATFAASGTVMTKGYGWASNRFIKPRGKQLREDAGDMRNELRARVASSKVPGLSWAAGSKYRRNYIREARGRNVTGAQNEYLADKLSDQGLSGKFLRRSAAGVAGQAGRTRAAAYASGVSEKARAEDLKAENALLQQEMQRLGLDEDTFAGMTAEYLEDPTNPNKRIVTGANGLKFDFAANETKLQRALLNSAASQGHVKAIEAARLNANLDQTMVDDIIRANDGTLKGKGGYHLATDFNLAAGRMQVHDPATGAMRAPTNRQEMQAEMTAQRLIAMSQTGLNSIAGMKTGAVMDSGQVLSTPGALRDNVLRIMSQAAANETAKQRQTNPNATAVDYRGDLHKKMNDILSPRMANTLSRSDNKESDFENIRDNL